MSKGLAAFALVVLAAAGARANGAFPDEFSIHFPAGAPNRIAVGANFGLVISEDNGATWRYSCEPWVTLGSSAALSDVAVNFYQVTADGSAFLASSIELTRSSDVGCTWPTSTGSVTAQVVLDIFASPTDASLVFAIVGTAANTSYLVASHDGGRTFDATHLYDTAADQILTGVEVSRSQPSTVYLTQVATTHVAADKRAFLLQSTSSGAAGTWTSRSIPVPDNSQPRIMAVDPADANVVYIRMVNPINDGVLITRDGGSNFDTPFTINGQFTSFLRATDGTLYAGTANGQLFVRPPGASAFDPTPKPAPHLRCLGQRFGEPTRIYACGDMLADGSSIFYSDNGGNTFTPVMKFTQIRGPLTCGPVQTNCAAHWERIQGVLGITPTTDAGQGGGGGGGDGNPSGGGCATLAASGATLALLLAFALRRKIERRRRL
jgi:hypothetical protein